MRPSTLPPYNYHGFLPEGVHETTWEELEARCVTNPHRRELWQRLQGFMEWVEQMRQFSCVYIDGGFVTVKAAPEDIDVILQPVARFGPEAYAAMEPFFLERLESVYVKYRIHLHFWCEGFPGGMSDFRRFFQYLRPQDAAPVGLKEGARKGIVKIPL